jgi:hypothetical protein
MQLSRNQTLALQSALLTSSEAAMKWNALVNLTDVEELDSSITRILPAIFQNLRGNVDVLAQPKLKGAHLFAWAKNTEFATTLKPLLQSLEESELDYRILKGGAINFLLGGLAARSMGDIDILVSKQGLAQFQELLSEAGFSRKFPDLCPHVTSGDVDQALNYINKTNIEIDLHVMEDRNPALLFQLMLSTPPKICELMDVRIKVPTPELLILHAIHHGNLGVQSSDRIQALLDTHRLVAVADKVELVRLSTKVHFTDVLEEYFSELKELTGTDFNLGISKSAREWHRLNYKFSRFSDVLKSLKNLSSIRKSRSVGRDVLFEVLRKFPGHRFAYAAWLFLGKLRPLERFFNKGIGGFLKSPQSTLVINQDFQYSKDYTHGQVQFNPFSGRSQDWRFAFDLPPHTNRLLISMRSKTFAVQGFLIFVNGLLGGVTDHNPEGSHKLEIHNPARHIEISLRLPSNGCEQCAQKLTDLVLQFA